MSLAQRLAAICLLATTVVSTGCLSTFYRSVDGISNSVALSIPSEESVKLQVLEYLSGQKVLVRDAAKIKHTFTTASSNDYFSIIHIREYRTSEIEVTPTQTNSVQAAQN